MKLEPTFATKVAPPTAETKTIRIAGSVPPEVWNRLGTKLIPKLRGGTELKVAVEFVVVRRDNAAALVSDLQEILDDLGVAAGLTVEEVSAS